MAQQYTTPTPEGIKSMRRKSAGNKSQLLSILRALICALCFSQGSHAMQSELPAVNSNAPLPHFDIASVREDQVDSTQRTPDPSSNVPLGPGNVYSATGGLFKAAHFPLMTYIAFAYRMTDTQLATFRAAAPEWVKTSRFSIQARTEKQDVTKDELRVMVRSLLKERFSFAVHSEVRDVKAYALELVEPGQTGPTLRKHIVGSSCPGTVPEAATGSSPKASETVAGGYPTTCGGIVMLPSGTPGEVKIGGRNISLALLANSLTGWGQLDRPITDKTGLTGPVDFVLEYVPDFKPEPGSQASSEELGGPRFREALRRQLGLKLVSEKGTVEVILLDHIDHPQEN